MTSRRQSVPSCSCSCANMCLSSCVNMCMSSVNMCLSSCSCVTCACPLAHVLEPTHMWTHVQALPVLDIWWYSGLTVLIFICCSYLMTRCSPGLCLSLSYYYWGFYMVIWHCVMFPSQTVIRLLNEFSCICPKYRRPTKPIRFTGQIIVKSADLEFL